MMSTNSIFVCWMSFLLQNNRWKYSRLENSQANAQRDISRYYLFSTGKSLYWKAYTENETEFGLPSVKWQIILPIFRFDLKTCKIISWDSAFLNIQPTLMLSWTRWTVELNSCYSHETVFELWTFSLLWITELRARIKSNSTTEFETSSGVRITTVSNSPNPSRVFIKLYKHGWRFPLLKYMHARP